MVLQDQMIHWNITSVLYCIYTAKVSIEKLCFSKTFSAIDSIVQKQTFNPILNLSFVLIQFQNAFGFVFKT